MAEFSTLRYKNNGAWIDILHPVNSFYFSSSATSPSELFGGTWVQITEAALRGAEDIGYTGEDACMLTVSQMPSHTHTVQNNFPYGIIVCDNFNNSPLGIYPRDIVSGTAGAWVKEQYNPVSIASTGGGQAISLVQRSFNCYIWYRTA